MVEETGPRASRNRLQTATLLDAIATQRFDAAIGGARRDEESARAKERIFSFRDDFGQWDPKHQRPELWNLYNTRIRAGEHVRVFPLSNWTELDVWEYIRDEALEVPSIYFSHPAPPSPATACSTPTAKARILHGETPQNETVRFRTVGDMTCTGAIRSTPPRSPNRRRNRRAPDHRTRRNPRRRQNLRSRHGRPQKAGYF